MYSKPTRPTFPNKTIFSQFSIPSPEKIETDIQTTSDQISSILDAAKKREHNRFVEAGGCQTCYGRGRVVVWDTMDSLSGCYAEYGDCKEPNCSVETRKKTGMDHSFCSKYDQNRGLFLQVPLTEQEQQQVNTLESHREVLQMFLDDHYLKVFPKKGDYALVVRGRKTPQGSFGKVFYTGQSKFGQSRIGFKNEKNEVFWSDPDNVCLIDEKDVDPVVVQKIAQLDQEYKKQHRAA